MLRKSTPRQIRMTKITPGLYQIGQKVRPIHDGEFGLYGYGEIMDIRIRKNANPYKVKFDKVRVPFYFSEDEICQ